MTECTNNAIKPSCFVFSSENPKLANCDVFLFTFLSCFTEKIPMVTTTKRVYSRSLAYQIRKKKYLRFFGFGINKYQFAKVKRTSVLFSPNIEVFFSLDRIFTNDKKGWCLLAHFYSGFIYQTYNLAFKVYSLHIT